MDWLLYPSNQEVGGQTAIIATATVADLESLPFVQSCGMDDFPCARSLLSSLVNGVRELCMADCLLLDKLDIAEALRDPFVDRRAEISSRGTDLDACDRETSDFESRLGYSLQSLEGSLQHVSRAFDLLLANQECSIPPNSSEISTTLLQFVYWVSSSYLESFCATSSANVIREIGPVKIFQVATGVNTGVKYICNSSFCLTAVMNWYQDRLVEQVLTLVADGDWHLRLWEDLRETIHSK